MNLQIYSENNNITTAYGFCPPWAICREKGCKCRKLREIHIKCGRNRTTLQTCACLSFDDDSQQFKIGRCIFNCKLRADMLVLENSMHNFELEVCKRYNRSGTLCGECLSNHWPLALSYKMDCVLCPSSKENWWKYVLMAFGPTTSLYLAITLFKLDMTSPYIYPFITSAQILSSPILLQRLLIMFSNLEHKALAMWFFNLTSSVYGIWSLDYIRAYFNVCLKLNMIQIQVLEYLVTLYPLYLIVLAYSLRILCQYCSHFLIHSWKPLRSCFNLQSVNKNTSKSLIDVYASFFVLSLSKLMSTTIALLLPVTVSALSEDGNITTYSALYLDGSKDYFGHEHSVYGILALVTTLFLVLIPTIVISLHSFKFSRQFLEDRMFTRRTGILIHHFVEKFQGYYKNGSAGTRDYRWFSSFHIALITTMHLLYGLLSSTEIYLVGGGILLIAASVFPLLQPYKNELYSKISFGLFLLLALWHFTIASIGSGDWTKTEKVFFLSLSYFFTVLPMCYCCGVIIIFFLNPTKWYNIAKVYQRHQKNSHSASLFETSVTNN